MAFQEVEMEASRRGGTRETLNPVHQSPTDQLSADIEKLRTAVRDMDEMKGKLGTKKDTTKLRARLKKRRADAAAADKAIRVAVQKVKKGKGTQQKKVRRILKDLAQVAEAYKQVAKDTALKERQFRAQSVRRIDLGPSKMEEGAGSGGEGDGAHGGDLQAGLRGSDAMLLNDVDLLILQERQEAAEAIAQDAVMLQDVTQELATLVADQGEKLNTMEKNVDEAKANTQAGLEHLEVAGDEQKKYRKKLWFVFACGIMIMLAISIPVLIKVTK